MADDFVFHRNDHPEIEWGHLPSEMRDLILRSQKGGRVELSDSFDEFDNPVTAMRFYDGSGGHGTVRPDLNYRLYYNSQYDALAVNPVGSSTFKFFTGSAQVTAPNEDRRVVGDLISREKNIERFVQFPRQTFRGDQEAGLGDRLKRINVNELTPNMLRQLQGEYLLPRTVQWVTENHEVRGASVGDEERQLLLSKLREETGLPYGSRKNEAFVLTNFFSPGGLPMGVAGVKDQRRFFRESNRVSDELFQDRPLESSFMSFQGGEPSTGTRMKSVFMDAPEFFSEGGAFTLAGKSFTRAATQYVIPRSQDLSREAVEDMGFKIGNFYGQNAPSQLPPGATFVEGQKSLGEFQFNNAAFTSVDGLTYHKNVGWSAMINSFNPFENAEAKTLPGTKRQNQPVPESNALMQAFKQELGNFPAMIAAAPQKPERIFSIAMGAFQAHEEGPQGAYNDFMQAASQMGIPSHEAERMVDLHRTVGFSERVFSDKSKLEFNLDDQRTPFVFARASLNYLRDRSGTIPVTSEVSSWMLNQQRGQMGEEAFRNRFGEVDSFSGPTTKITENVFYFAADILESPHGMATTGKTRMSSHRLNLLARNQPEVYENLIQRDLAGEFRNPARQVMRAAMFNAGGRDINNPAFNVDEEYDLASLRQRALQRTSGEMGGAHQLEMLNILAEENPNRYLNLNGVQLPPAGVLAGLSRDITFNDSGNPEKSSVGTLAAQLLDKMATEPEHGDIYKMTTALQEQLDTYAGQKSVQQKAKSLTVSAFTGVAQATQLLPPGFAVAHEDDVINFLSSQKVSKEEKAQALRRFRRGEGIVGNLSMPQPNEYLAEPMVRVLPFDAAAERFQGLSGLSVNQGQALVSQWDIARLRKDADSDLFSLNINTVDPNKVDWSRTHDQFSGVAGETQGLLNKIGAAGKVAKTLFTDPSDLFRQRGFLKTIKGYMGDLADTSRSTDEMSATHPAFVEAMGAFASTLAPKLGGDTTGFLRAVSLVGEQPYQLAMDMKFSQSPATTYLRDYYQKFAIGNPKFTPKNPKLAMSQFKGIYGDEVHGGGIMTGDRATLGMRLFDRSMHMEVSSSDDPSENEAMYLGEGKNEGFADSMAYTLAKLGDVDDPERVKKIQDALKENFKTLGGKDPGLMKNPEGMVKLLSAITGTEYDADAVKAFVAFSGAKDHVGYQGGNSVVDDMLKLTLGTGATSAKEMSFMGAYLSGVGVANTKFLYHEKARTITPLMESMGNMVSRIKTGISFRKGNGGIQSNLKAVQSILGNPYASMPADTHMATMLTRDEGLADTDDLSAMLAEALKGEPLAESQPYTYGRAASLSPDETVGPASPARASWKSFSRGGFTGDGETNQPAGVVHAGEYVLTKKEVEAIRSGKGHHVYRKIESDLSSRIPMVAPDGLRGYVNGGIVYGLNQQYQGGLTYNERFAEIKQQYPAHGDPWGDDSSVQAAISSGFYASLPGILAGDPAGVTSRLTDWQTQVGDALGRSQGSINSRMGKWGLVGPDTLFKEATLAQQAGQAGVMGSNGAITVNGLVYTSGAQQAASAAGVNLFNITPAGGGGKVTANTVNAYVAQQPVQQAATAAAVNAVFGPPTGTPIGPLAAPANSKQMLPASMGNTVPIGSGRSRINVGADDPDFMVLGLDAEGLASASVTVPYNQKQMDSHLAKFASRMTVGRSIGAQDVLTDMDFQGQVAGALGQANAFLDLDTNQRGALPQEQVDAVRRMIGSLQSVDKNVTAMNKAGQAGLVPPGIQDLLKEIGSTLQVSESQGFKGISLADAEEATRAGYSTQAAARTKELEDVQAFQDKSASDARRNQQFRDEQDVKAQQRQVREQRKIADYDAAEPGRRRGSTRVQTLEGSIRGIDVAGLESDADLVRSYDPSQSYTADELSGISQAHARVKSADSQIRELGSLSPGSSSLPGSGFTQQISNAAIHGDQQGISGQSAFKGQQIAVREAGKAAAAQTAQIGKLNLTDQQADFVEAAGLDKFISKLGDVSSVIAKVNTGHDAYIKNAEKILQVYDAQVASVGQADAALKAAGGDRGKLNTATNQVLDAADAGLRGTLGGAAGDMSRLRATVMQKQVERGLNVFDSDEERQSYLTSTLLRGGRIGALKRGDMPDEAYEGGLDVGFGFNVGGSSALGRAAINTLGAGARISNRLYGGIRALQRVNWEVVQPMMGAMDEYQQSEMQRQQAVASVGGTSYGDLMGGTYGNTARRLQRQTMFNENVGQQISLAYGGLASGASEGLGRTVGGLTSILGPAVAASIGVTEMTANPFAGAVAGGLVGVGAAANYVINASGDTTNIANTVAYKQKFTKDSGQVVGALRYMASDPMGALASTFSGFLNPEVQKQGASQGHAQADLESYYDMNSSARYGATIGQYVDSTGSMYGLTNAQTRGIDVNAFIKQMRDQRGIDQSTGLNLYTWNNQYGRNSMHVGSGLYENMIEMAQRGIGDPAKLSGQVAGSLGISQADPRGQIGVAAQATDLINAMPLDQQALGVIRMGEGAQTFAGANAALRSVGMSQVGPAQMLNLFNGSPASQGAYAQVLQAGAGIVGINPAFSTQVGSLDRTARSAITAGLLPQVQQALQGAGGNPYAASLALGGSNQAYNLVDMQTGYSPFTFNIGKAEYGTIQASAAQFGMSGLLMDQGALAGGTAGLQAALLGNQMQQRVMNQTYQQDQMTMNRQFQNGGMTRLDGQGFAVGGNLAPLQQLMMQYGQSFDPGNGMGMYQVQDAQTRLGRAQQDFSLMQEGQSLGISRAQFNLGNAQFGESMGLRQQQINASVGYQRQEMNIGMSHTRTQEGWQMEDLQFGRNVMDVQFGWQQEDYTRNIRYARGREKRDLMREQSRATISYAMQAGHEDVQENRQKEQMGWTEEEFTRKKNYFEQTTKFQQQQLDMDKKFHDQNITLENQRLVMQEQAHVKQMTWIGQERGLEDQNRLLTRQFQEAESQMNQKFSQQMFGMEQQAQQLGNNLNIVNQAMQGINNQFSLFVQTGQALKDTLSGISGGSSGGSISGSAYSAGAAIGSVIGSIIGLPAPSNGGTQGAISGHVVGTVNATPGHGHQFGGPTQRGPSGMQTSDVVHANEYVVPENGALVMHGGSASSQRVVELLEKQNRLLEQIAEKDASVSVVLADGRKPTAAPDNLVNKSRSRIDS